MCWRILYCIYLFRYLEAVTGNYDDDFEDDDSDDSEEEKVCVEFSVNHMAKQLTHQSWGMN